MKTIAQQYESYATLVMPADASPAQRQETRRAFYAGATLLFSANAAMKDQSETAFIDQMLRWQSELVQFQRDVQAGIA